MKIAGVRCALVPYRSGSACALQLLTDEQLIGHAMVRADVCVEVDRLVADLLVGEDPRATTGHWQRMHDAGASVPALSALDIALWDLKARINGEPLWKTAGGSRPRIPAHVRGDMSVSSDEELDRSGCGTVQLAVDTDRAADLNRIAQLAERFEISIDAGGRWSPKEAIRAIRAIEEQVDLKWVVAPTRRGDFLGARRVSDAIRAPLCIGGLATTGQLLPHLHHRSFDILKIGAEHGGITGVLQQADAAFGFELPVILEESPGNLNLHLAGALPYCMSLEVTDVTDLLIQDGCAVAA